MDYKSFDKLNDTFDVDNDIEDIDEFKTNNGEKQKKQNKTQKYTLDDLEYLKTELQDRIENNRIVANELAQTLKVGAPPRLYEVYAKLSSTISDDIMHLADISRQITDYQIVESKEEMRRKEIELKQQNALKRIEAGAKGNVPQNVTQINNNTYNMTSKDLLDKVIDEMGETGDVITDMKDLPKFNFD